MSTRRTFTAAAAALALFTASSLALAVLAAPAVLRAADDAKPAAKPTLAKPANKAESWRLEQHEAGKAAMTVDGDAVVFEVTDTGAEEWHVQAVQTGLDLADGKEYILSFKAKAAPARTMTVNAMIDADDWHTIGLTESAELGAEWQDYKYEFKAEQTSKGTNRVTLVLGNATGKVWLKDLTLSEK